MFWELKEHKTFGLPLYYCNMIVLQFVVSGEGVFILKRIVLFVLRNRIKVEPGGTTQR